MAMEDMVEKLEKTGDEEARRKEAEKKFFKMMTEKLQKPTVENVIEHLETAYAVKDHDGTFVCWCATKDKADFVASCVDMMRRATVGMMVHKMFS